MTQKPELKSKRFQLAAWEKNRIELNEIFVFFHRSRAGEIEPPKWPEKEQKQQDRLEAARGVDNPPAHQQVKVMGGILGRYSASRG